MTVELLNIDCMDYMKTLPDKHFDLAVVDPPYGINVFHKNGENFNVGHSTKRATATNYHGFDDHQSPDKLYFNELFRISKQQIIWGGNYFAEMLFNSSCWLVWDKLNGGDFADCELAWTSFKTAVRKFAFRWSGMIQGDMKNKEQRIHPTQKPVKLYQWVLSKYSEPSQRVFDSHLGSGSSAIAAHYFGCDFVGCEIDPVYHQMATERFNNETKQIGLEI